MPEQPERGDGPELPAQPSTEPARRRASGAIRRPGRGQLVVAVLLALLGFAAAVQVRSLRVDDDFAGARRGDLVQLLQTLSAAQTRAARQLNELQATRDALEASTDQRAAALEDARRQLEVLQLLSGQVAATGPGVAITIKDPGGNIGARTLLNAVGELRDAGAEAIEINNSVRVVAQTWFGEGPDPADPSLSVDGRTVSAPYVIEAIGSPQTLAEAVTFPGGLADEAEALGGTVAVTELDSIQIESLAPAPDPDYAEPAT